MTIEQLHVTIGQVKVARPGQSLHAILGSCVGIGFLFVERSIYGLAHCLLSKSKVSATDLTGRHVDSAISSLSSMMSLTPADRRKVGVFVVGGANMTMPDSTDPKRLVGQVNSTFALHALKEAGFRIRHDDLGGNSGRQVTINGNDGSYEIAKIPRLGG
jgi:chemotaxis protein CheD